MSRAVEWEQTAAAWDAAAAGYAVEIAPRTAPFAADLVGLLAPAPGTPFLDVACGPGTVALEAARAGASVVAVDFSNAMVRQLAQRGRAGIEARQMDGQALQLADASFACAASLFGLQFFPDRGAGLRELRRVLVPGGRVAIGAWCEPRRVELLTPLLRALHRTVSVAPTPGPPLLFALADRDRFAAELRAAGFRDVTVREFAHPFTFARTEDYWRLIETAAPLTIERLGALPPGPRAAVRSALDDDLRDSFGNRPITLEATAHIAVGVKP